MKVLPKTFTGPGLVDLQINGYAGVDFNGAAFALSAQKLHAARLAMARRGIMVALPTVITDEPAAMIARVARLAELTAADDELSTAFRAIHVEGPFISAQDGPRGAHPRAHCLLPSSRPDLLDRLRDAARGRLAIFTLAPELDGAIELIEQCAEAGICPAIGHTAASADQIAAAVKAGARLSTHLGNGSHQLLPRLDNYVQSQLADDRLRASFIADGHHIPLTTLKNFIRAKRPGRCILVSDVIAAADMSPGIYEVGGRPVDVRDDGRVQEPGAPHLAGSAVTLDVGVVNAYRHCGVRFEQAWAMASAGPAKLLGLDAPQEITVKISEKGFVRQA